ncbi:MAG: F0F1 ATP synthase subunit B' [Roseomonas sp.]|nr:F0F1 ATP synthase subunit B' [Roseomonas sp.]MCA3289388.1 F0F1 ATP synthase subunit B' [Roseomonas sp.]MCA3294253.1 F0F1 ATP synthase subunit B' [Roseomonas sp.]MCA4920012.1 F0F1 ATP synthase subunit B' [Roseomonas sp.]
MRRILLAMTLSAMPALAWAASSAGGPPVEGMPQLAFGHPVQGPLLIGQVVWQVIIFFALFMLMAFVALPRLGAVIENRRQRIEGDLDAARAAMQSAEAAIAAQREATQTARAEAQAAVNAAMQAAQQEMDAKAEALNAALAKQVADAEARIDQGRKAALGAVQQVASDTVGALLAKLGASADAGKVQAAVQHQARARGIA